MQLFPSAANGAAKDIEIIIRPGQTFA